MVDIEDVAREIWRAMEGISDGDGQAILREALAEAWGEGYLSAAETSGIEYGDNPYREGAVKCPHGDVAPSDTPWAEPWWWVCTACHERVSEVMPPGERVTW